MGDQNKSGADPNQGIQMQDFGSVSMGGAGPVSQSQCLPGLPTLAPALPGSHPHNMQTSQIQQIHAGQHPPPQQSIAGQPMTIQQPLGQPQFHVIQQPFPGQQYATFPQFAYANQQGTVVLQPAQFSLPGGPGQPQGQQVILTGVPQKPGQPQMISNSQANPAKGGQPSYTITSSGQIQMPGPGPQPQQTFMLTNPMGPGIQGPVTMTGPNGQSQTIHTSIAGMKDSDGKPVPCPPPQLGGQPNPSQQPQFVIPSQGMTYMQTGPHPILQNGQIIFRTPAPPEQVMFSPSGQTHNQPQPPVQHPSNMSNSASSMGGMPMSGSGVRPTMPVGPPPGKTAISRSIAPLLPNVSQTTARIGYNSGNPQGQPSPKSKQKMSPRGLSNGLGRPPAPKGSGMKMLPRMAGVAAAGSPVPGSPGSPGSPRPPLQLPVATNPPVSGSVGPPTLSPMTVSESPVVHPPSVPSTTITTISHAPKTSIVSSVSTTPSSKPSNETALDPPTLTKEINTPVPSLGQPTLAPKPLNTLAPKPVSNFLSTDSDQGLVPTPKAVVKPHVLTHVIDGHLIKESSQPFPVSPVKATARRKPEKTEDKNLNPVSVKRGPGRPPGSTKSNENLKTNGVEPPEKKLKTKENLSISAPQTPFLTSSQPVQPPQPVVSAAASQPAQQPAAPQLPGLRSNPLKWNVTEVCDFVKSLPGCGEYVDEFAQQEIDGQALMLLKADHLMTAMSIKLGPALKICSHIEQLREELNKS